jgi:hypothetical protein
VMAVLICFSCVNQHLVQQTVRESSRPSRRFEAI